jgi:hypothetical protein
MARRGERPPIGLAWIVTWPLSAAFAAMVFLAGEELRHPGRTTEVAPPPPTGGADWSARFPERIAAIDAALHKTPLDLPKPIEDERGSGQLRWTHRLYTIDLSRAQRGQAETAIDALRGVDPGLTTTADNTTAGTDVRIGLDGLLVSTLRFRFVEAVTPKPPKPRLAVVIGPLGDDLRVARQVVAIEGPVVLSVRPFRPFSREVAELARMFQHEVLVQLDGSESEPSEGGARADTDLDAVLASVPQAVGVVWQGAAGSSPRGAAACSRRSSAANCSMSASRSVRAAPAPPPCRPPPSSPATHPTRWPLNSVPCSTRRAATTARSPSARRPRRRWRR